MLGGKLRAGKLLIIVEGRRDGRNQALCSRIVIIEEFRCDGTCLPYVSLYFDISGVKLVIELE